MTSRPHIICAVRGHPTSRATVTYAIDLARKLDARLTFFHVITAGFLEHATIGPLSVVYAELREVSEFMMLLLQDRARRRGVTETDYVIREGNILKQLRQFVQESNAQYLIIGKPSQQLGRSFFDNEARLRAFAAEIEASTDIQVILVDPDEVQPD